MPSLLDLAPETRALIFHHLFAQPSYEILGLSREPEHDYDNGPPSDWVADSRQVGLVYEAYEPRTVPTNSRAMRTCRKIYGEAVEIFYQTNKIRLYTEDNNDIFYWLLDIGERNRRSIKHLEIGWAYGVAIESGRGNIHGILQSITDMTSSSSSVILHRRAQLMAHVRRLEDTTVRLIIRTLHLLLTSQSLLTLAVYLPGVDGGDIWDLPNDNLYFEQEIFSNSTTNVHACIPEALAQMQGLERLEIGYTKDIELAEAIARKVGAKQLVIRPCAEGKSLNLGGEESKIWRARGWTLEGALATKILGNFDEGEAEMGHEKDGSADPIDATASSMRGRKRKLKNSRSRHPVGGVEKGGGKHDILKPEHSEKGRLTASMFSDRRSTGGEVGIGSGDASMSF